MVKRYYRRRYKKRKIKRIQDQIIRLKLDFGSQICYMLGDQQNNPLVFDASSATPIVRFAEIFSNSIEMKNTTNVYTQFFARMKLYGIKILVTPTKPLPSNQTFGGSCYIGYQNGKTGTPPSIDVCRGMNTAFQLPNYGANSLTIFRRIKGNPWLDTNDEFQGFFFVMSNINSNRQNGPQWECRLSLYVKFRGNTL